MEIIKGKVIKGEGIGEKQGYPTANLSRRVLFNKQLVKGVYLAEAELAGYFQKALLIIGVPGKRKFKQGKVEVYFLDFKKPENLTGRKLTVKIYKKLRPLKKYKDLKILEQQIKKDIKQAKQYFN